MILFHIFMQISVPSYDIYAQLFADCTSHLNISHDEIDISVTADDLVPLAPGHQQ